MSAPVEGGTKLSEAEHSTLVAEQFDDTVQQHQAATLGMWIFLATEVLFFGGLIASLTIYRFLHYQGFLIGSHHLSVLWGGTNTAVLICSSLTMALAVRAAQLGKKKDLIAFLFVTLIFGLIFLFIKFVMEWRHEYLNGLAPGVNFTYAGPHAHHVELFMVFYFILTGLHALHMIIGCGIIITLMIMASRGAFSPQRYNHVEIAGLYWHFVDIVWIFLFPLLYLIGGRY
ncbi:MAG: cytochrome c oxidase subunit 3 family protein [Terriglobia bacterium]